MYDEKYEWVYVARYFGLHGQALLDLAIRLPRDWRVGRLAYSSPLEKILQSWWRVWSV